MKPDYSFRIWKREDGRYDVTQVSPTGLNKYICDKIILTNAKFGKWHGRENMNDKQAPPTDQELVRSFGAKPDFVVDSPDAVPAPQAPADPNYCESDWHDTIHSAGSTCPGCSGAWVRSAAMTALDREMRRQAPPADLREQAFLVPAGDEKGRPIMLQAVWLTDALAVFAERERLLRERIMALPWHQDNRAGFADRIKADVLAEIDKHA